MSDRDRAKECWLEVKSCIEAPEKMGVYTNDYDEDGCVDAILSLLQQVRAEQVEVDAKVAEKLTMPYPTKDNGIIGLYQKSEIAKAIRTHGKNEHGGGL